TDHCRRGGAGNTCRRTNLTRSTKHEARSPSRRPRHPRPPSGRDGPNPPRRPHPRNPEADQLDVIYREFTLFEQYVARRITPQLAEHTSELLSAVTEGKYDRVEFNENYGIEVYDG